MHSRCMNRGVFDIFTLYFDIFLSEPIVHSHRPLCTMSESKRRRASFFSAAGNSCDYCYCYNVQCVLAVYGESDIVAE